MVIPNTWAIHRNEDEYPDANKFIPERFLTTDAEISSALLAEGHYGFGFGRRCVKWEFLVSHSAQMLFRACPGKYLATRTIWLGLVRLIWAFDITPKVQSLNPDDCTSGITM